MRRQLTRGGLIVDYYAVSEIVDKACLQIDIRYLFKLRNLSLVFSPFSARVLVVCFLTAS